jgi:hypothetical protein
MGPKGWWVPLTGVAFVVLLIVGFAIGGEPPDVGDDSAREVVDFYVDGKDGLIIGAVLQTVACAFFVFFFAHLSRLVRLAEGEGGLLSRVTFGGALIFAAGGAFDATLIFVLADSAEDISPQSVKTLAALYENDFLPLALGILLILLSMGLATIRLGVLPKWLGWIALALVVIALTPIGFAAFIGTALWILVVSILLTVRGRRLAERAPA